MNSPFFSIIIPSYNRSSFIKESISSVLKQSYNNFELIIVDDGSIDDTELVVQKLNDQRIVYLKQENKERGAARNNGINNAKGTYLTFLDSDDKLFPEHLEVALHFIEKENPQIFHQQYEIRADNKKKIVSINSSIKHALIKGNPLSCMGIFIKREIALINLFNEDRRISGSEDYELWLRYAAKYSFLYNPVCTSSLTIHPERSVYKFNKSKLVERKLLMLDYAFSDEDVRKVYRKYKNKMYSNAFSYIALHSALLKNNKLISIKYLLRSFIIHPFSIFQKRTAAIIKHLIN